LSRARSEHVDHAAAAGRAAVRSMPPRTRFFNPEAVFFVVL
jgi:hypothetical protein